MIDKVLWKIADENEFKTTESSVFGLYHGQLINMSTGANGQYNVYIGLSEGKSDLFSMKDNQKKLRKKLKCMRLVVEKDHLIFEGIPCGLREKSRIEKLEFMLNDICTFLAEFQTVDVQNSRDVILIGNAPFMKSEDLILKKKLELKRKREKGIDYQKGLTCSAIGVFLFSCFAGIVSGLMNINLESDINEFGKAIIIVVVTAGIFKKFSGGIDKLSKWIIGGIASLGYLVWEIVRYAVYFKFEELDFTADSLVNLLQENIEAGNELGISALICLVVIWGWTLFAVKRTDSEKVEINEGRPLSDEQRAEIELILKGNKYSTPFIIIGFFVGIAATMACIALNEGKSDFSISSFITVFVLSHFILWYFFSKLRAANSAIDKNMKMYGFKKMPAWYDHLRR